MTTPPAPRRRGPLRYAVDLAIAGPVLYAVQVLLFQWLVMPWWLVGIAAVAILLAIVGICRTPTWGRGVLAGIVVLVGAFEIAFVTYFSRLPVYDGPVAVGQPFPCFAAEWAGGGGFTDDDLRGRPTVLTFFRGRWCPICRMELTRLEKQFDEFEKRGVRIVVASMEGQDEAKLTQADCPHLIVLSDERGGLADAAEVIHKRSSPTGGDTSAPTTILIDAEGRVKWMYRPTHALERVAVPELLAAIDQHLKDGPPQQQQQN